MHETLLYCIEDAMHEHITTNTQSPTQKFNGKLKNFEKPQNLGLKCINA